MNGPTMRVRTEGRARVPVLLDVAAPGLDRSRTTFYGTPGFVAPEVAGGSPPVPASTTLQNLLASCEM